MSTPLKGHCEREIGDISAISTGSSPPSIKVMMTSLEDEISGEDSAYGSQASRKDDLFNAMSKC